MWEHRKGCAETAARPSPSHLPATPPGSPAILRPRASCAETRCARRFRLPADQPSKNCLQNLARRECKNRASLSTASYPVKKGETSNSAYLDCFHAQRSLLEIAILGMGRPVNWDEKMSRPELGEGDHASRSLTVGLGILYDLVFRSTC